MANWKYTIDIKDTWKNYADLGHSDYDEDEELFSKMKEEIITAVVHQMQPHDHRSTTHIISKLKKSKHLSSFNKAWDELYDYFDFNKIWMNLY